MVEDGAFSHKIDDVTIFKKILISKDITASTDTSILLNGWILLFGGASVVEGL